MKRSTLGRSLLYRAAPSRIRAPWLITLAALAPAGVARAGEPKEVGATLRDGGGCEVRGGGCRALSAGSTLARERSFVAGEQGAVLELWGGGVARLAPSSRVRVSATQGVPVGRGSRAATTLRFERGAAQIVVGEAASRHTAVLLRLPHDRAAVIARGTAAVRVEGDAAVVAALEGDARASPDDKVWSDLPEGRARRFDREGPPADGVPLLEAPSWLSPSPMTTDLHEKRAPLRLAWSGAPGASGYELVVRRKGEGLPALVRRLPAGADATSIDDLPAGAYTATLFSLDNDRLEGRASPPLDVRVVGVELPAGATTSREGLVRLGPDQEVRLRYAEGLEASTDLNAPFASAPDLLGLGGRGQRLVRLRTPGGAQTAELLLSRRSLRAEIEVGPRKATWPSVPLDVRVRLLDQDGASAPGDALATPLVMLGLHPLDARWQRVGNELRASLEPERLAGPSIVRVEVLDERGALVGRDFVEIVPDGGRRPEAPR